MMPTVCSIVVCVALFVPVTSFSGDFNYHRDFERILASTQDSANELYYPRLLHRFRTNDVSLSNPEVLALLIGFTANSLYHPYDDLDTERRVFGLNGEERYSDAIALADSFLLTNPMNQVALIEKSYAYYKLQNPDSARFFSGQFGRIMEAMEYSGDATSPTNAAFALGPADGQNFVTKYLRYRITKMGSGRDGNNYFLDVIWGLPDDGEEPVACYFNIDHAMKDFRQQLRKASQR